MNKKEYYIITTRHKSEDYYEFWCVNKSGYTFNINNAGLYDKQELDLQVLSKKNRKELLSSYTDFFIHKNDLELIGSLAKVLLK